MKMFSKDILYQEQDDKLYLIKDGVDIVENTGGLEYKKKDSGTRYFSFEDGYVDFVCPIWGGYTIGTATQIDFSKYIKVCVDIELPNGLGNYGGINWFFNMGTYDSPNELEQYRGTSSVSRRILESNVPDISEIYNPYYFQWNTGNLGSASQDIRIYNLWLERGDV